MKGQEPRRHSEPLSKSARCTDADRAATVCSIGARNRAVKFLAAIIKRLSDYRRMCHPAPRRALAVSHQTHGFWLRPGAPARVARHFRRFAAPPAFGIYAPPARMEPLDAVNFFTQKKPSIMGPPEPEGKVGRHARRAVNARNLRQALYLIDAPGCNVIDIDIVKIPMRGSMLCEVHRHTIRDDPEHKKLARGSPAAPIMSKNAPHIPTVGLLRLLGWLQRYLLSQPCPRL